MKDNLLLSFKDKLLSFNLNSRGLRRDEKVELEVFFRDKNKGISYYSSWLNRYKTLQHHYAICSVYQHSTMVPVWRRESQPQPEASKV